MIHCQVVQVSKRKSFFLTFVYGLNTITQRQILWRDLRNIAGNMHLAWGVVGDFNTTLYPEERIGGDNINYMEINDFATCIEDCGLQEVKSTGAFFTWTNKSTWSKLDRMVANSQWYLEMDYTHISCITEGLSDHTPLKITFPGCENKRAQFKFCEMWINDPKYKEIVQSQALKQRKGSKMQQVINLFNRLRGPLRELNRDKYADIHEHQRLARLQLEQIQEDLHGKPRDAKLIAKEKKARERYLVILKSPLSLLRQQSKQQWINQGDQPSRLFFAKMKQQKLSKYVYTINDVEGNKREGFEEVAKVMNQLYKRLLGEQEVQRAAINWEVMRTRPQLTLEQQMKLIIPFSEKEIKEAILEIPSIKSPGPDGFSSSFFKAS